MLKILFVTYVLLPNGKLDSTIYPIREYATIEECEAKRRQEQFMPQWGLKLAHVCMTIERR